MEMDFKKKVISCIIVLVIAVLICLTGLWESRQQTKAVRTMGKADSDRNQKKIAITFDDGPDGIYTELLLDGLQKRSVKATFFVMGKKAEEYPELILRMQQEGHIIGNHTYSHIQLSAGKAAEFKAELLKTNQIIEEITGETPMFVRPPFGTWDKKLESELNMFPVLWTIDPMDWCSDDAGCVTRNVLLNAGENDIILMHDQYKSTVTAAFQIIDTLKEQGFEFVTVEEILLD